MISSLITSLFLLLDGPVSRSSRFRFLGGGAGIAETLLEDIWASAAARARVLIGAEYAGGWYEAEKPPVRVVAGDIVGGGVSSMTMTSLVLPSGSTSCTSL